MLQALDSGASGAAEACPPESAQGWGSGRGPRWKWKRCQTWVKKGEAGRGGAISASVCACWFSSHNCSLRLAAGRESHPLPEKGRYSRWDIKGTRAAESPTRHQAYTQPCSEASHSFARRLRVSLVWPNLPSELTPHTKGRPSEADLTHYLEAK